MTEDMQKMSMDRGEPLVAADHTRRRAGQAQDLSGQKRLIRRNGTSGALLRLAATLAFVLLLGCGSSSEETTLTLGGGVATSDWMAAISSDAPVSLLSIPGTHDTCTYTQYETMGGGFVKTQDWSISDQLQFGIRFLDIRGRLYKNSLTIHHGIYFLDLTFQDVLDACKQFLQQHPKETILLNLGDEYEHYDSTLTYHQVFINYYNANKYLDDTKTKELWYLGTTIPTLGQVRGKIVLMRGFALDHSGDGLGIDVQAGCGNSAYCSYKFSTNPEQILYTENLWTPDFWQGNPINVKWDAIQKNIERAESDSSPNHLYTTFMSATCPPLAPWLFARNENPRLVSTFKGTHGKMGIVIMDFPGGDELSFIINKNFER